MDTNRYTIISYYKKIKEVVDFPSKIIIFKQLLFDLRIDLTNVWTVMLFRLNSTLMSLFDVLAQRVIDFKNHKWQMKFDYDNKFVIPIRSDHLDIPHIIIY